jgi:DNA-binding NarL/FixJ family response regulator
MSQRSKAWTPEQQAEIAEWYAQGYTAAQIAAHVGTSLSTTKKRLSAMKAFKSKAKQRAAGIDIKVSRQDEVAELLSQGMSIADIAKAMNTTQGAVKCTFRRIRRNLGSQAR